MGVSTIRNESRPEKPRKSNFLGAFRKRGVLRLTPLLWWDYGGRLSGLRRRRETAEIAILPRRGHEISKKMKNDQRLVQKRSRDDSEKAKKTFLVATGFFLEVKHVFSPMKSATSEKVDCKKMFDCKKLF